MSLPFLEQWWMFVAGDASPEVRLRMARIAFRIGVAVHIAWACGFLAPLGLAGFVSADDLNPEVQEQVEPIRAEVGKLATKVGKLETAVDLVAKQNRLILMSQIASEIRDLYRLKCSTKDEHIRLRMERSLDERQEDYKQHAGERYPLPSCKDL